jgi:hypothetical protein
MNQVKLRIPKKAMESLEILAKKRNHSLEKIITDAISTEAYLDAKLNEGFHILAQDPITDEFWRIRFSHIIDK